MDIIERLQNERVPGREFLCLEAAAEIAHLRAEGAQLKAALEDTSYPLGEIKDLMADNARLRAEVDRLLQVCKDKTELLTDAYATVERLRAILSEAYKALATAPSKEAIGSILNDS